ncbi:hypothetical protein JL475_17585 [Streptomyces sp. M2CJ-2]|nr:hypothetical protein [Streptomyces sp. M2CJ-2]
MLTAPPLLTVVLATGCGPSGAGHTGTPLPPPPSPSATSAEDVCVRLVAHWSREVLEGTPYGDHQSTGLSDGPYATLREAVDAARPVRKRQVPRAAHAVIVRQVREACAERYRTGAPDPDPRR